MASTRRIAFVTSSEYPALFEEESAFPRLLLERHGLSSEVVVWSHPDVDWRAFDLVLIRSTWDYFTRVDEFRAWLQRLESMNVRTENALPLMRWNFDKLYLAELALKGAEIVPTCFIRPGESRSLEDVLRAEGWPEAVLKPTVSGGAYRTVRFRSTEAQTQQHELETILGGSAAMVQPFLPEIQTQGEWSLLFFDGVHSHTVLKKPAAGDFRVQSTFGGVFEQKEPPAQMLETARRIVGLLPEQPLYVRIDGVELQGRFHLMEVEAIEPYLFTLGAPGAAERFVDALVKRVSLSCSSAG